MESDDNISILQRPPVVQEGDSESGTHFGGLISPLSPTSSILFEFDQGSHHALQKAYTEVKRRFDESNCKNQLLSQRIKELESLQENTSYSGQSHEKMDDMNMGAQGATGLQQAAEEAYAYNLQRQLTRAKAQLQAMEQTFQEKVQESEERISSLMQQLQDCQAQEELLRQQKMVAQQQLVEEVQRGKETCKQLQDKCDSLQAERDKAVKENALLHVALKKAEQEVAVLRENQGEGINPDAREVAQEVAHMRKVIASLKAMVLEQKERLTNSGAAMSLTSGRGGGSLSRLSHMSPPRELASTAPSSTLSSGHSGGSRSAASWEMVSGVPSSSPLDPQQQQQMKAMQQRLVPASSSTLWRPGFEQQALTTKQSVTGQEAVAGRAVNGGVIAGRVASPGQRVCRTAVVQRRPSQDLVNQPRSKSEIIRSPVDHGMDWVDGELSQRLLSPSAAAQHTPLQNAVNGNTPLEQLRPRDYAAGVIGLSGVKLPSASQPQLPALSGQIPAFSNNGTVPLAPSMHIINQSGMAGARVIRNHADNFSATGTGGRSVTERNQLSGGVARESHIGHVLGLSDNLNREAMATSQRYDTPWKPPRGLPQESEDLTPFQNAAALGMNRLSQAQESSQVGSALDRKCPVCGQDFSHVSMDEFQTHVFECFDNAEDSSIPPETLQPQQDSEPEVQPKGRVCPMCEKQFPKTTSQPYFEGHVQSHFEEASADPFEVLDVQKT